ncbi:hypothetical protein F52700_3602 [Fusarium sp. NRRL 52700]|nr:hypothetical protein F52700_3602 [Fusarium sp. NRRL 52700]
MDPSAPAHDSSRRQSPTNVSRDTQQQASPNEMGYPKLARLMGDSPETGIFRRFRQLNMLNLLRLQAEIHGMEDELFSIIEDDQQSDISHRKDYARSFFLLQRFAEQGSDCEQYELMLDIGKKLEEYNSAVAAASAVACLPSPEKRSLAFLRLWLDSQCSVEHFPLGTESTTWNFEDINEYFKLDKTSSDRISSLVRGALLDAYHTCAEQIRKLKKRPRENDVSAQGSEPRIQKYDDEKLRAVSDGITAALASLLPTVMILILYFVKRMLVRIGLVIVFTTLFSIIMSFYPGAKKGEVFAAVAAFAAVEVVFIGSTST